MAQLLEVLVGPAGTEAKLKHQGSYELLKHEVSVTDCVLTRREGGGEGGGEGCVVS